MGRPSNALTLPATIVPAGAAARYDAFISYSHAADARLAPALQSGLHQLARPWYRLRTLRVFRDRTTLGVTPSLWPAIEAALQTSRWFIYLASPEAAASPWVEKELAWWLEHRSPDHLLIVLTGGELDWHDERNTFDPDRRSAIPDLLLDAFPQEPRFLDLRWAERDDQLALRVPAFRDAVAELSATLQGRSKDELDGEDVRQHRRTQRIARAAIASLALLTAASATTSVIAVRQRNLAEARRQASLSRQLAAEAAVTVLRSPARVSTALALAIEAVGGNASAETERVLRWLVALRPKPVLTAQTPGSIMEVALHRDGRWVAALDFSNIGVWSVPDSAARHGRWPDQASLLVWSEGADAQPRALAASPAGDVVAFAVANEVRIRSFATGVAVLSLEASDTIRTIDFHPAGNHLATGADDGLVQLWSLQDGREVARLDHGDRMRMIAFSPDGDRIASLDAEGGFCVMDSRARGEFRFDPDADGPLRCRFGGGTALSLAWSSDGTRIATAIENAALVWDLESESPLVRLEHYDATGDMRTCCANYLDAVTFSPDNRLVATGSRDFSARVWDAATGRELARLMHGLAVEAVRFASGGKDLVTASEDGTVRVWDALRGKERLRGAHGYGAVSLSFDASGRLLASAARDGTVRVWRLVAGDELLRISHDRPLAGLATSPGGTRFAAVDDDAGVICVWNMDGRRIGCARPPGLRRTTLRFATEQRLLAWRSGDPVAIDIPAADTTLRVTPLLDARVTPAIAMSLRYVVAEQRTFREGFSVPQRLLVVAAATSDTVARIEAPEFTGEISSSRDGTALAFERQPGEIVVVELPSLRELHVIATGGRLTELSLANGPAALSAEIGGRTRLWRLDAKGSREVPFDTATHVTDVFPILSPDGERLLLVAGSTIEVHHARTGRLLSRLPHGEDDLDAIRWAPDTAIIATVAGGRVRVWEMDTGRLVAEFGGETWYHDVGFLNGGRHLVTVDHDGYAVVRLWRTEDVLRAACALLDAPLTRVEWEEHLRGEPYRPVCSS